jgi:hypothetical protein
MPAKVARPFLWGLMTASTHRQELLYSFFKDVARVFVMAMIVDLIYQIFVLHGFYPLQLLFVATSFSTGPYLVIRGPVTRIARYFYKVPVSRRIPKPDPRSLTSYPGPRDPSAALTTRQLTAARVKHPADIKKTKLSECCRGFPGNIPGLRNGVLAFRIPARLPR